MWRRTKTQSEANLRSWSYERIPTHPPRRILSCEKFRYNKNSFIGLYMCSGKCISSESRISVHARDTFQLDYIDLDTYHMKSGQQPFHRSRGKCHNGKRDLARFLLNASALVCLHMNKPKVINIFFRIWITYSDIIHLTSEVLK